MPFNLRFHLKPSMHFNPMKLLLNGFAILFRIFSAPCGCICLICNMFDISNLTSITLSHSSRLENKTRNKRVDSCVMWSSWQWHQCKWHPSCLALFLNALFCTISDHRDQKQWRLCPKDFDRTKRQRLRYTGLKWLLQGFRIHFE